MFSMVDAFQEWRHRISVRNTFENRNTRTADKFLGTKNCREKCKVSFENKNESYTDV